MATKGRQALDYLSMCILSFTRPFYVAIHSPCPPLPAFFPSSPSTSFLELELSSSSLTALLPESSPPEVLLSLRKRWDESPRLCFPLGRWIAHLLAFLALQF